MDQHAAEKTTSPEFGSHDESTISDVLGTTTRRQWIWYSDYTAGRWYMWYIYPPAIVLLGTAGNLMTIVIMQRLVSGEGAINLYFTAIAVMDTLFLWLGALPLWLRHLLGYNVTSAHSLLCKLYSWIMSGSATVSCWYLVCMTAYRAMSVVWPHRIHLLCTRRLVLLLIAGITVFFALLFSHYTVGRDRVTFNNGSTYVCQMTSKDYIHFFQNIFLYIDTVVYCLLPFVLLVFCNSVLVWKLTVSVKAAGRRLAGGDRDQIHAREKAANSVTLTVIVVSMAFLVLTLPSSLINILMYTDMLDMSGQNRATVMFVYDVTLLLGISNSAVNFYLYCLTGRRFREEFVKVVCCGWNGRWRGASSGSGDVPK